MSELGPGAEFDLIRRFLARAAGEPSRDVLVGPGDDAAVVTAHPLAISVDLSIEGTHFRRDWLEAGEIGWRATAAALSDLAAMAARPVGVLLSVAAAGDDVPDYVEQVVQGAIEAARAVGAHLIGGDATRSPGPLVLDVVVVGEAHQPLRRDGARPGDEVWVTGRLGAPAAAVRDLIARRPVAPAARERFARPSPRTREMLWLRGHADLTAAIDLSDGIAGDVPHLAAASGVGITIERDAVPVHEAAADDPALAILGGEDYELCVVAPPGALERVVEPFRDTFTLDLTRIGTVEPTDGTAPRVRLKNSDGTLHPMPEPGFKHFAGKSRPAPESRPRSGDAPR